MLHLLIRLRVEGSDEVEASTQRFLKVPPTTDVKCGSRTDTIDTGTPCNLIISFTYNWTQVSIVYVVYPNRKCADFVNLLVITQITM